MNNKMCSSPTSLTVRVFGGNFIATPNTGGGGQNLTNRGIGIKSFPPASLGGGD
jgi:hypothetical protein